MKIKNNWKLPEPPKGFTQACAFHYKNGDIILDWTRVECDFSSEYGVPSNIDWPFLGKEPITNKDWMALKIEPIRE